MAQAMKKRLMAIVLLVGFIGSLIASLVSGVPDKLPGAALGSEALLHAGRTLAFFAAYLAVLVVFVRGWEGELPYELSGRGLKYKTRELKEEIQGTIEALIEANEELADRVDELKSRMDSLENRE